MTQAHTGHFTQKCTTVNKSQLNPFESKMRFVQNVGHGGWDQYKKHSPAHTYPGQRTSFITFLHLQRSTASSLFSLRA